MFLHRSREWWDKAIARAERTVAQTMASTLPVGFIITPTMIEQANWRIAYVLLAWIATALFGGVASLITSYAKGIPEVEDE